MHLLIASNNAHKAAEIKQILGSRFESVLTLKEYGLQQDIEETGSTFLENAQIKAKTIAALTGLAAIADDSGLIVPALDGAPGIYSARYAGAHADDAANNRLLLKNMQTCEDRRAAFYSAVCLKYPDGRCFFGEGRVEGEILHSARGVSGFGYDPLFFSYELGKTFAEATADEKNKISHRARALSDLLSRLRDETDR